MSTVVVLDRWVDACVTLAGGDLEQTARGPLRVGQACDVFEEALVSGRRVRQALPLPVDEEVSPDGGISPFRTRKRIGLARARAITPFRECIFFLLSLVSLFKVCVVAASLLRRRCVGWCVGRFGRALIFVVITDSYDGLACVGCCVDNFSFD
ncbi:hypothetical protein CA235_07360 [Sphingomonas sp. ABOLF]|nr:hypothetical protein CA235_07360 [Sphingomonas sp. ABOLF]